jgi:hypothetical protein
MVKVSYILMAMSITGLSPKAKEKATVLNAIPTVMNIEVTGKMASNKAMVSRHTPMARCTVVISLETKDTVVG